MIDKERDCSNFTRKLTYLYDYLDLILIRKYQAFNIIIGNMLREKCQKSTFPFSIRIFIVLRQEKNILVQEKQCKKVQFL